MDQKIDMNRDDAKIFAAEVNKKLLQNRDSDEDEDWTIEAKDGETSRFIPTSSNQDQIISKLL